MAAQSRQMNVDPVVVPIDQVGTKWMMLGVSRLERRVKRANVARVKSVNQLLDIRAIDFDQFAREVRVLLELVDPAFDFLRALIFFADYAACERRRLLEKFRQLLAGQVVSILRHDDRFQMRSEPAHRATVLAMLAAIAERGQLDQPAHRQRIPIRGAELVDGLAVCATAARQESESLHARRDRPGSRRAPAPLWRDKNGSRGPRDTSAERWC